MSRKESNRWKGLVLGAVGGVVGVTAMDLYWKAASALAGSDPREAEKESKEPGPLDDISLIGKQHEDGESSTGALGRHIYRMAAGKEPKEEETRTTLSYLVHWAFTLVVSGAYGAVRGRSGIVDIRGGLALGIGLWLFGDEVTLPLVGLSDGPTAYPPTVHAHGLAAHVVFGLSTAVVTQALQRLTGKD